MKLQHDELTPGQYLRTWAGYTIPVEIRRYSAGGPLHEIAPSGNISAPSTMPDATWEKPPQRREGDLLNRIVTAWRILRTIPADLKPEAQPRRCKTCKYWTKSGKSAHAGKEAGGYCQSEKITEDYTGNHGPDMLVYPYVESGSFWTGPEFGCVHHDQP